MYKEIKDSGKYVPIELSIKSPDKTEDIKFTVNVNYHTSDERETGGSRYEPCIDIDTNTIKVLDKKWDKQLIRDKIEEKLDNHYYDDKIEEYFYKNDDRYYSERGENKMNKLNNFSERLQKITFGEKKLQYKSEAEEIWQDFYDKGNLDQINDDYAMDDYFDFYFKETPEITDKKAFKSNVIDILRDSEFNRKMLKENDDNPDLYYEMSESEDAYFSALLEDVENALNVDFSETVNFGLLDNIKSAGKVLGKGIKDAGATFKEGVEKDRAKKGIDLKEEYDKVTTEQKYVKVLIELLQDDAKKFPKGKKVFEKVIKLLQKIDGFLQKRLEKIAKNKKFKAADKLSKQNTSNESNNITNKTNSLVKQMPDTQAKA